MLILPDAVLGNDNGLGDSTVRGRNTNRILTIDSTVRNKIVDLALRNTGVCEVGTNRGKIIDKYRSIALDKKIVGYTDPWCAYFIAYIYKSSGIDTKQIFKKGYVSRAADWFQSPSNYVYKKGIGYLSKKKPQKGDLVGYKFSSGRISHIGILIEWNQVEGYALVVEGNTTPRNSVTRDENHNDCVRLKKRPISLIYIVTNVLP